MGNKPKLPKEPIQDEVLQSDAVDIVEVQDTETQPVIAKSKLQPGYVELALKSGKGKTVVVPRSTLKYYPEDVWVIVDENTKKK